MSGDRLGEGMTLGPCLDYHTSGGAHLHRIDSEECPLPESDRERALLRALLEFTLTRLEVEDPDGNIQ